MQTKRRSVLYGRGNARTDVFAEYAVEREHTIECEECGKQCKRQATFKGYMNPLNPAFEKAPFNLYGTILARSHQMDEWPEELHHEAGQVFESELHRRADGWKPKFCASCLKIFAPSKKFR